MVDESPSSDRLVLTGTFDSYEPSELFAMWVVPDFLELWWPERAEVHSGVNGTYRFSWPGRGWTLQGTYTAWEPKTRLAFTWKWNHDPADTPEMQVDISFKPHDGGGTDLTIMQWPYRQGPADQTSRDGHREGWMHFCMRLAGLREGLLNPMNEAAEGTPG